MIAARCWPQAGARGSEEGSSDAPVVLRSPQFRVGCLLRGQVVRGGRTRLANRAVSSPGRRRAHRHGKVPHGWPPEQLARALKRARMGYANASRAHATRPPSGPRVPSIRTPRHREPPAGVFRSATFRSRSGAPTVRAAPARPVGVGQGDAPVESPRPATGESSPACRGAPAAGLVGLRPRGRWHRSGRYYCGREFVIDTWRGAHVDRALAGDMHAGRTVCSGR